MKALQHIASHPRVTVRNRNAPNPEGDCVVYWMRRAQRGKDNDALNVAVEAANLLGKPVVVFFGLVPHSVRANLRHYTFLAEGLPDIADALERRNIGFVLRRYPDHSVLKFCNEVNPALVVSDENALHQSLKTREKVARKLKVAFLTVDADVVVPSKLLLKEQYAAHIIRNRLAPLLKDFLVSSKDLSAELTWKKPRGMDAITPDPNILKDLKLDRSVQPVSTIKGGAKEANRWLQSFIKNKLSEYPKQRNHPESEGTSHLSAYLHFGHIGPKTVALAVQASDAPKGAKEVFLDQLITWRELAVNFVTFNPNYDNFESGEPWALRSLGQHQKDERPVRYTERQLENAETYDDLWNAAQMQMVNHGWMHNYVRMYWAKKILEWSPSAAVAYQIAVRLNDKYEIDGRDPNGYMGIAWSIVGKFDRPWFDRPIFGTVRYMSLASTGKKFNSKQYIAENLGQKEPTLF
ncbi:MAG TPA: deoxyribodipyrimidine photo-lyase [Terriglobales bacterium]|jgi:deoxyribodipyrimidine photo-lyase